MENLKKNFFFRFFVIKKPRTNPKKMKKTGKIQCPRMPPSQDHSGRKVRGLRWTLKQQVFLENGGLQLSLLKLIVASHDVNYSYDVNAYYSSVTRRMFKFSPCTLCNASSRIIRLLISVA